MSAPQSNCRWRNLAVCAALAVAILLVFWPVHEFGFTHYDDENYVTQNPHVPQGLTLRGIWWAFTTGYFSYWHPLTWISHMTDVQLFGMNGPAHHLVSVFFHIANSILVFLWLNWVTRSWGKSAFVAALFALHPTHVESVAWIAERKDALSGFFWIAACWAYAWYAENRQLTRYVFALFLFGCGLMSKPMVVTLPCVLILLDWWPLGRFAFARYRPPRTYASVSVKQLIIEKIPFFAGSLLSSGVTYYGVHRAGAIVSEVVFPIGLRWANVPISYARYLGKLFWPTDLTVLYPMPPSWPPNAVFAAAALVAVLTICCLLLARPAPYLLSGWLWFLGPLVPTIGIIPVGWQSLADRYTYLPFIGLFWMLAWGVSDLLSLERARISRIITAATGMAALIACAVVSRAQTWVWKDTESLFRHSVKVTGPNFVAEYNLALARYLKGDRNSASEHFQQAIRINPKYARAHNNLGVMLLEDGDYTSATNRFDAALRLAPEDTNTRFNLARALAKLGDCADATGHARELLRVYPKWSEALQLIAVCLAREGKFPEAQGHFEVAIDLKPQLETARMGLARTLIARSKPAEALQELRNALQRNPQSTNVMRELAWTLATHPNREVRNGTEALRLAEEGVRTTSSKDPRMLATLAAAQAEMGNFEAGAKLIDGALALCGPQEQKLRERLFPLKQSFAERKPFRESRVQFDDLL